MSKIRAIIAAALVTVPALTLNAEQVQMPSNATSFISDARPTTMHQTCCAVIYIAGMWICIMC
ncbi:MAG TPA: hypothetical protein VFO94_03370 [Gammaproteobacteria bacterium]|nr:hypothetical protein [Gammaproteobacteria bacterium]